MDVSCRIHTRSECDKYNPWEHLMGTLLIFGGFDPSAWTPVTVVAVIIAQCVQIWWTSRLRRLAEERADQRAERASNNAACDAYEARESLAALSSTTQEVHGLVNSRMGEVLAKVAALEARVAELTGAPADLAKAADAAKASQAHDAKQERVSQATTVPNDLTKGA
jgi:hypothetical protein